MPPRSALLTAGTTPNEKPVYTGPRVPVTTRDKIRKAAVTKWKKEHPKNVPREAPMKSNPKPRSLPPPDEAALLRRAQEAKKLKASKAKSKSKSWGTKDSGSMTTQQKIRAAEAKSKAKDPYGAAVKEAAAKEAAATKAGGGKAPTRKAAKAKPPGMMSVIASHGASSKKWEKVAPGHRAVMSRRTQRAEKCLRDKRDQALKSPKIREMWMLPQVQNLLKLAKGEVSYVLKELGKDKLLREIFEKLVYFGVLPAPKSVEPKSYLEIAAVDLHGEAATFRFMELPKELRLQVYEHAVVEPKIIIRPDSLTGREQPDIAMTCREIRAEVLPVFYAQNHFAVDLTYSYPISKFAAKRASGGNKVEVFGIQALERWAGIMESSGWFGFVRNWVLDYEPTQSWSEDEDGSFMLSVRFARYTETKDGKVKISWGAEVQVHQEASCIMPAIEGHNACTVEQTPKWLNEKVISVCNAATGGSITPDMIAGLAKAVKGKAHEVGEHRCKDKVKVHQFRAIRARKVGSSQGPTLAQLASCI